jgi:hypothetical protein
MLRNTAKFCCTIALLGIATAITVIQNRSINHLREQNALLLQELDRLSSVEKESLLLSNRLAETNTMPGDINEPSSELLRLRGMVASQRQEVLDMEQAITQIPPATPPSLAKRRQLLEATRLSAVTEHERAKTLSEQLMVRLANHESLPEALLASGLADDQLSSLIEQRESANRDFALSEKDSVGSGITNAIAILDKKIADRAEGIRIGIDLRAASLKLLLENLQKEIEKAKETSQKPP